MYDKSVYEVEYSGGAMEKLIAKILAENVISQVESEVRHYQVLTEVTVHKRYYSSITKVNGVIKSSNLNLQWKRTTRVWKLLVEFNYGSFYWVPLNYLKQYNPVKLSGYDVTNEISDEPAFSCWVNDTFLHRGRIISKIKYN